MDEQKRRSTFDPGQHLTKVKGQDYLETKWRLAWFRAEHPDGIITTDLKSDAEGVAVFVAHVQVPGGGSSTGWGTCRFDAFDSPFEKAETKAIGRALAALGYGTQFAGDDFAEAGNIVDAPVGHQQQPQGWGGRHQAEEQANQQYQQQNGFSGSQPPPQKRPPVGFGNPPTSGTNAATAGQVSFAEDLLRKKVPQPEWDRVVAEYNGGDVDLNNISKADISRLIDDLKARPTLPGMGGTR